jgi:hypothetical protein
VAINLPPGSYRAEWIDTRSGKCQHSAVLQHAAGTAKLASPSFVEDIALRLTVK